MILDEDNCESAISSFKHEDWKPLLALIPKIESSSAFVEPLSIDPLPVDPFSNETLRYKPAQIVEQFAIAVDEVPIIISFNWPGWDEGRRIASDPAFDFDTVSLATKCKLLTAIIRNDRFCTGALVSAFESGLILRILKSIEKEVLG